MPGLLTRIARASGVALEAVGAAGLDARNRELEAQRATRLENLRQKGRMALEGQRRETGITAATATEERRQIALEESRTYEREVADPAALAAKKEEITHRLEEEFRIESAEADTLLKKGQTTKAAKEIFDSAEGGWFSNKLDMTRWGDNETRAKAEIADKLDAGWTQTDVYTWLENPEYAPEGGAGPSAGMLDQILSDKVAAGVTEKEVLEQILATPQLQKIHSETQRRLGQL